MLSPDKMLEREQRAKRLVEARVAAGFDGQKEPAERFGWNVNTYKAHEYARNGIPVEVARQYAKAYKVSLKWLLLGVGNMRDKDVSSLSERLQDVFLRLADIPVEAQAQVLSFAEFTLRHYENSRDTATRHDT